MPEFLLSRVVGNTVLVSLFLCVTQFALSRLGDWSKLARRYPASERPVGTTFFADGGRCGVTYVNGSLRLIAAPVGLYVAVGSFWGRPFHPPLLLPWSGVQSVEWRQGWFAKKTVLVFKDEKAVLEIYLSAKLGNSLRAAVEERRAVVIPLTL